MSGDAEGSKSKSVADRKEDPGADENAVDSDKKTMKDKLVKNDQNGENNNPLGGDSMKNDETTTSSKSKTTPPTSTGSTTAVVVTAATAAAAAAAAVTTPVTNATSVTATITAAGNTDEDDHSMSVKSSSASAADKKKQDMPEPSQSTTTAKEKVTAQATAAAGKDKIAGDKDKDKDKDEKKVAAVSVGMNLGSITIIDTNITNTKVDGLQLLHTICYDNPGKSNMIKKNLRKFSGFDFDDKSDAFKKKMTALEKVDMKQLKGTCDVLELEKTGTKEDICDRICQFLLAPEGSEEPIEEEEEEEEEASEKEIVVKPTKGRKGRETTKSSSKTTSGRPKRSTAGRGVQRDYSSSEDSVEKEIKPKIKRRRDQSDSGSDYNPSGSDSDFGRQKAANSKRTGTRGRPAGRRAKKPATSESEEEETPTSDAESEVKEEPKNKRRGRQAAPVAVTTSSTRRKRPARAESESPEESEPESDESETPKKKISGRTPAKNAKTAIAAPKTAIVPKGKGRPKRAAAVKSKVVAKEQSSSEEEEEEEEEEEDEAGDKDGDASEDEPLAKKAKPNAQPPTDDDIKSYVKEILDEANLEEITMKTVCKQVYAKYPQFDLSHKKNFIKTTVKSLIAT